MENRIPDISDWLQFLEAKEASNSTFIIGIGTLFISVMIGIPVFLSYSNNVVVSIVVIIIITSIWLIVLRVIVRIGKEIKKSRKILDKILKYNINDVYDIRNEWFKNEQK